MSFLDAFQKQQTAGMGQTFTQQAAAMKQALTGKEVTPVETQKTGVAEQIAAGVTEEEKQRMLEEGQRAQQQQLDQVAQINQQQRLTSLDYQQKTSTLVAQVQRQADTIYSKLSENYAVLDEKQKESDLTQLEFLHNLADRRYVDQIQIEGDKRRLDDEMQMKSAIMYATFKENIDFLNQDIEFNKALQADDRAWKEYIATISPEAAIQFAVQEYESEQSAKATKGMGEGIVKGAEGLAGAYKPSSPPTVSPAPSTRTKLQPIGD